jgi:hypothetical protein
MKINYRAEATPAKFHACDDFVRGIMGPLGSGKSVACTIEILTRAFNQIPDQRGHRKTRWAIIRNTYPELKTTTLKTWNDWVPIEIATTNMNPPITSRVKMMLPDQTTVDAEVIFLALDRETDIKKLLSLELTGAWMNEAREIGKTVLDGLTGRVGRFPAKKDGGPSWSGIFMDTNPPDDDHWWYNLSEVQRPEGYSFFRQPGAMMRKNGRYSPNPDAENVVNQPLGMDYWRRMIPGKTPEWIKVYVEGDYGTIYDGRPVYPEYSDSMHCQEDELDVYRGLPIFLGWDFGLTPACVFGQQSPRGQVRIIDELYVEDMGLQKFVTEIVKPHIGNNYSGMRVLSYGDPAGVQRAGTDEQTCFQLLAKLGIPTEPTESNATIARTEAVSDYLNRMSDGEPAFMLSPKCRILRKGFNGGYRYKRMPIAGTTEYRFKDAPEKNKFSHPHDALQYCCMGIREMGGGTGTRGQRRDVKKPPSKGWT